MERLIKTLPCEHGDLFVTTAGRRLPLAKFNGRIEIFEHTNMVPILNTVQKGIKTIHASVMICGDLEYQREDPGKLIHSGNVYDATADVVGELITFAGMSFEDSDPIENELTFNITDLELVKKLLKM